jgi:hypothetical protein
MSSTPGIFHFKIKSYDNEEGEYSAWQQAEPGTIIQFVINHWFNKTLPNNLDIIVIKNEKGDQLIIDHENKDVFRFFLIPPKKGLFYYYKMTDIRFMFFTLEHFCSGLLDTLRENMNQTSDDWRWVQGDFIEKNFHFKITHWRLFKHFIGLGTLIICLIFLVGMLGLLALDITDSWFMVIPLVVVSLINFRSSRRSYKWYQDQKHLQIQLSKGDRFIHVWYQGQKKSIAKAEIASIEQHWVLDAGGENSDWVPLYTAVSFQNGDTLNLHRILIPQDFMADKFFQEANIFQVLNTNKRALQKPTSLMGYFPESKNKRYMR